MFRFTNLGRVLANSIGQTPVKSTTPASGVIQNQQNRENTGGPPAKLECFVDGKKVLVDPGTTVLQVSNRMLKLLLVRMFFTCLYLFDLTETKKQFCFNIIDRTRTNPLKALKTQLDRKGIWSVVLYKLFG